MVQVVVDAGVADPSRIAVGGHSYGAFMAANLLAHAGHLFAAGIARSGAYNRCGQQGHQCQYCWGPVTYGVCWQCQHSIIGSVTALTATQKGFVGACAPVCVQHKTLRVLLLRTLTPFGFQAEERTLWQAPDTYALMSPFQNADKIKKPLLLIHGADDNNTGA
jgi:pimeloyl-ACP methyl ester carboxylesterase